MIGERRENIEPLEVAIQRVLAYRRRVAMLLVTLDEDLKDLMHLQVLSSHSSPSHGPRPLERPSATLVPSTNHSVLSSLSSPSHSPRPLEGPSSSPSPVPSTNLSGIRRKELTNCLQYLQPEQPGLSHGSVMLKEAKVEELELNRKYGGEKAHQLQYCELCKVPCMNETLLKQHFQGKKHKHKLQEGDQPKWCELCKVPCMNETLLKQHFQGKKHKHKLQEVESSKHGEEREREPYYDEDLSISNSPDISGAERQPSLSNVSKRVRHDLLQQD